VDTGGADFASSKPIPINLDSYEEQIFIAEEWEAYKIVQKKLCYELSVLKRNGKWLIVTAIAKRLDISQEFII
jgi:hypothetical protein